MPDSSYYHPSSLYGIYRLRGRHGQWEWRVAIQRRKRVVAHRAFQDHRFGGEAAALRAAQAYRDSVIKRFPPLTKSERNQVLYRNNRTGTAGVIRTTQKGRSVYRAATKLPDGRHLSSQFSVAVHGEEQALALAIVARMKQLQQVEGVSLSSVALELHRSLRDGSTDSDEGVS